MEHLDFVEKSHFSLLDGIRGLSIAAVLWHHSSGFNPSSSQFFLRGYLGVDMFFVLSGFLITFLLIKEKRRATNVSLRKFYIRRTLRIFPLYFAFLAFSTIWLCIKEPEKIAQVLSLLPYYAFYISNWIPPGTEQYFDRAWSLAVEEQFYLVWPVLFALLPLFRSVFSIVLFVVIVTVLDLAHLNSEAKNVVSILIPFRTLLLGCLLALALCNAKGYQMLQRFLCPRSAVLVVVAALIYAIARVDGELVQLDLLTVHILMVLFLGCAVVNEENFLKVALAWRPLQICGVVSYGIYIVHGQFWGVTQKLVEIIPFTVIAESRITFSAVFIFVSCVIALLSYHFFESWFLGLKKRYGR